MKFTKIKCGSWELETPYKKIFYGTTKRDVLRQFYQWWIIDGKILNPGLLQEESDEANMQVYKG